MLKIGEFSKLSRVSVRMLRHYDEVGLLAPSEVDPMTGYRYYSERQLITAGRIAALRALGFGLSETRELLRLYDDRAALDARLAAQRTRLEALAAGTAQKLRLLDTALARLRKEETPMKYRCPSNATDPWPGGGEGWPASARSSPAMTGRGTCGTSSPGRPPPCGSRTETRPCASASSTTGNSRSPTWMWRSKRR